MAHEDSSLPAASSPESSPTSETTPLIQNDSKPKEQARKWPKSVVYRVLFAALIVSPSMGVTQVPLIYVLGVMTCDEYYRHHDLPPFGTPAYDDRCNILEIDGSTARAVTLLGVGSTVFLVANLFFTGWMIKTWGMKRALLINIIWPAMRSLVQTIGVTTGAGVGIIIVQCSQVMLLFGGPAGYILSLNSYATEVVQPSERTAVLGRGAGCAMAGTALGFYAGGMLEDHFSHAMPYQVAFCLFCFSTVYCFLSLPHIPINKNVQKKANKNLGAFFEPLRMFTPRIWTLKNGTRSRQFGVLLLGVGAFLAVLCSGYLNVLLQMYATNEFNFDASENSKLISLNFIIRATWLTFVFPVIISSGRSWLDKKEGIRRQSMSNNETGETEHAEDITTGPDRLASTTLPAGVVGATVPVPLKRATTAPAPISHITSASTLLTPTTIKPAPPERTTTSQSARDRNEESETFHFDLLYARYSLFLDAILTFLATFTATRWQLYTVAVILPFAAGTGAAAKGVMLQMCAPEEKTDALSAISLLESVASFSTVSLFGLVFSGFAEIGMSNLTFACNAAVAVVGVIVLMFAKFPPDGAVRYRKMALEEVVEEVFTTQDQPSQLLQ